MNTETESSPIFSRREALRRMMWLMGGAIVGAEFILNGTRAQGKEAVPEFSAAELALMDEMAETIIPTTDTPGAKAAKVGPFMAMMVNECYDERHHTIFRAGLNQIDEAAQKRFGKTFVASSPIERTALVNALDAEERSRPKRKDNEPASFFTMARQLTVLGYFTSEIGCTQALRYVEVPGAYHGNVPYKKGERAWFNTPPRPVR